VVRTAVVWFWGSSGSGGRLFWGRSSVLGTVVCSGDGRQVLGSSVLETAVCSGDGRLFWGRSSVLGTVVCSGDGRLVLATVVWFWRRSSAGCRSGASKGREDVRVEKIRWLQRGSSAEARVGYREYSGDPIALCVARMRIQGGVALRVEVSLLGGGGVA